MAASGVCRYGEGMHAISAPASVRVPTQRPRISVILPAARRVEPANDGATRFALALAVVRAALDLDLLVVADHEGVTIASVGDLDAADELAAFARAVSTLPPPAKTAATRRVGVMVESIRVGAAEWTVAATAAESIRDAAPILAAVEQALPDLGPASDDDAALAASIERAFDADDDDDPFAGWLD